MRHDVALTLSDKHRAWLERTELLGIGTCVFNMLNPSTATADRNDPTITRCIGFARRFDASRLVIVNLFTARATHPSNLWGLSDPAAPEANAALERAFDLARIGNSRFICAWGASPCGPAYARELHADRVAHTVHRARIRGVKLWALGFTGGGEPRHPLYVRGDAELVPYLGGAP